MDDNVHLSAQPRQVSGAKSAVLSVHVTFHNGQMTQCGVQRLLAACIRMEECLGLQERLQALQSCRATKGYMTILGTWERGN